MIYRLRALLAIIVLSAAQFACNLPAMGGTGQTPTELPAPNQALTALFAITPPSGTATATLPPVVTATRPGGETPTATPSTGGATSTAVPTPTTAAQRTPTPTLPAATATIPSARTAVQVIANFLTTPPTLDGDWSEWKDITREYPANHVTFGKNNWANEDDLAGSFHIGWDNNNLYIAVKVRDDKYVQNASGENIFKGDSIELLVDTKLREDYYTTNLSPDDFQLGISPGRPDANGTKEAYLWFPSNIAGGRSAVKIASRNENGIYRVEAAIPWTVFEVTPAAGMHLGFVLSVSDNDNASENVQQSMVSNVPGRRLTNPTTWGDLQLVK